MDLPCIRCGEPWDLDYVVHEAPCAFVRQGGLIRRCPSCPKDPPRLPAELAMRLSTVAAMAQLFGDDLDGLAATLEDGGLL